MGAGARFATLVGVVVVVVALALLLGLRRGGPPAGASPSASHVAGSGVVPSGASASSGASAPSTSIAPPVMLVGAGDIADCNSDGDEATAKLLDGLDGTVFTLGDNAYDLGTLREFRQCYDPGWGRQLDRTKPVPGNHDYLTADAAGYFGYFGAAAGDPSTGWYAYDAGAWRVYVLNSNCDLVGGCDRGSPQERWLRDDLTANPRECVLAMWHHPLFSSGLHGDNAIVRPLWRTLEGAGAELILNGHDHDYERFAPQTATGAADHEQGIIEMVVGTGGRSHYPTGVIRNNSLVRDSTAFGVLRLELGEDGWSFEFVPVEGASFTDSGSGRCH